MRPLALLMMLFLLLGLIFSQGFAQEFPQEEKGWEEEPWNEAPTSPGQNASAMPDLLPFNMTEETPRSFRPGMSEVNSSDYLSRERQNELWIRNNITWTQYLLAQTGEMIELVAYAPAGGSADLYRIYYASGNISHRGYDILPGYYLLKMNALEQGRIMLVFAVDNQPANAVIIDVLPFHVKDTAGPVAVESLLPEKARVIIQSESAKDYDIFVDGAFYSSDIGDGVSDGVAGFALSGEKMHTIVISKRDSFGKTTYKSEHKRYFKGGYTYTLKA